MNRHSRLPLFLVAALLLLSGCSSGIGSRGPIQTPVGSPEAPSPIPSEQATATPSSPGEGTPAPTRAPTAAPGQTEEPTACNGESTSSECQPVEMMRLKIYFLMADDLGGGNPTLVPVSRSMQRTVAVGAAAMRKLLEGPSELEVTHDPMKPVVSTAIPEGTLFLGLDIKDGLATVDLSKEFESGGGSFSMGARLAQVVYTLTQFPTVERVRFRLDGEPVTVFSGEGLVLDEPVSREDYLDYLPAIFVDSPAIWEPDEAPIRMEGVANVFEAQFIAAIEDSDGVLLQERSVMATCGTGCWGAFDATIGEGLDDDAYYLNVWEPSAMDGSRTNWRRYPIYIGEDLSMEHGCGC
jgi:germination protein M